MNGRLAAALVTADATGTAFGLAGGPANAAVTVSISSVSPTRVAAGVPTAAAIAAGQDIVTIKGKNFLDSTGTATVDAVDVGGDTNCQGLAAVTDLDPTNSDGKFVIVDATTIKVNLPDGTGCAATDGDAETVKLSFSSAVVATKTKAITFVQPPAVGTNKAYLLATEYVTKAGALNAAGGEVVRVTAATTAPFTKGVKATIGDASVPAKPVMKAMKVLRVAADGSYFDAVTPAVTVASPDLTITDNGLSVTFAAAANGLTVGGSQKVLPTVTGVSPSVLPALEVTTPKGYAVAGEDKVSFSITGSGFSTIKTNNVIGLCGVLTPAVVVDSATTSKITAHFSQLAADYTTAPTLIAANKLPTGGSGVGPCTVTVKNTVTGNTSYETGSSVVVFSNKVTATK